MLTISEQNIIIECLISSNFNGENLDKMSPVARAIFHNAARFGHHEIITFLLKNGIDVNRVELDENNFYCTALYSAARFGHRDVVALLLANGADFHIEDSLNITVLQRAASEGHLEVVKLLLEKGAAVKKTGEYDINALCGVLLTGHVAIATLLIESGIGIKQLEMVLDIAMEKNNVAMAQALMKKDLLVNQDKSALYLAVKTQRLTEFYRFFKKNHLAECAKYFATIVLCIAARLGEDIVAKVLITYKMDVNQPGEDGATPLYIAIRYGRLSFVRTLMTEIKAVLNPLSGSTYSPTRCDVDVLFLRKKAAQKGKNIEFSKLLTKCGVVSDTLSDFTPLHAAIVYGHKEIAQLLEIELKGKLDLLRCKVKINDLKEIFMPVLQNELEVNKSGCCSVM
jgi:ankyrin repeat protein